LYSYTLNRPKLNRIGDYIEWFTITIIRIHSHWNRARQEKLVKSMQNRSRAWHVYHYHPRNSFDSISRWESTADKGASPMR